jgi:cytochrome c-type biogenesis protein CcmH/NrfG
MKNMTPRIAAVIAGLSLLLGIGIGMAAKLSGAGMAVIRDLPAHEAGLAALAEAERLAGSGSWELIAVGRVYYLSGDKEHGQMLFDRATSGKQDAGDYARIGRIYAQAGDSAKATDSFRKMLDLDPKDDSALAETGGWYIRVGDRAKGEELLAQTLKKHPNDLDSYLRAAEGFLQVPEGN